MNQIAPPSLSRGGAQPPDDLDGLLRAFFKAEMPQKWPVPASPSVRLAAPPARKTPKGWPVLRTRLALAASVLILAAGALLLAGAFHGAAAGNGPAIKNPSAKRPELPGAAPTHPPVIDTDKIILHPGVKLDDSMILGPDKNLWYKVDASYVPANPK